MSEDYSEEQDDMSRYTLTEDQIIKMKEVARHINNLATIMDSEPVDTKVIGLLQIAADLLMEQAQMEKYYSRGEESNQQYKLLDNNNDNEDPNTASAEELAEWFNLSTPSESEEDKENGDDK